MLVPGVYQFEAWGASGGGTIDEGVFHETPTGLGGYVAGKLTIEKPTTVYIYVGGQGANAVLNKASVAGGWNGGGTGSWDTSDNEAAGGGGGATDFRLVGGDWNSFDSLKSRIMVAGAGGGQCTTMVTSTPVTAAVSAAIPIRISMPQARRLPVTLSATAKTV